MFLGSCWGTELSALWSYDKLRSIIMASSTILGTKPGSGAVLGVESSLGTKMPFYQILVPWKSV